MPTLAELRDAAETAQAALRDARDRLGRARDRAHLMVDALNGLQLDAIDYDVDASQIATARANRDAALVALADVERELRPDRPRLVPIPGS